MVRTWKRVIWRLLVAATASAGMGGVTASAAGARVTAIFYQCGQGSRICEVAPSGGPVSRLTHAGDFAGVASNGRVYGYLSSEGRSWEAPVSGGAATNVNTLEETGDPRMSANGDAFLADAPAASGLDAVMEYPSAADGSAVQITLDTNLSGTQLLGGLSYGWSGSTALTAHWIGDAAWICIGGQAGSYCGAGSPTARTLGTNGPIDDPDGSPDGSQIVAVSTAPTSASPSIVLFDVDSGAPVRTLVPARSSVGYATPRFSPDGTAIVFEAFPVSDSGETRIETVSVDGGPIRTVTDGSKPYWAPATAAARPRASLPAQTLANDSRAGQLLVGCHLAGAGRCAVSATITAHAARALGLTASGHTPYRLATGAGTVRRVGATTLRLRLQPSTASALMRPRVLSVRLTATSTARGKLTQTMTTNGILRARLGASP